jgi:CBS domain-containing protein
VARRHIEIEQAGPRVTDVMMAAPHTNPVSDSIGDARAALSKSSVKLLVLVDGDRFAGTVERSDLPPDGEGSDSLAAIARVDGPRLDPADGVERALDIHRSTGAERIPVVDADGVLCGLVCLNLGADHFCA